jgi:uncharacterized protein YciI
MPLFVISYVDKPGSLALRMKTREANLAYAHGKDAPAKVELGGPYLDEKGDMGGSLIIVEAPTRADAMAFTENDPYVRAGLFSNIDVRAYRVAMNKLG